MGRKRSTGSRFNLGPELDAKLDDFCAASNDTSATAVIRRALHAYIDDELENNRRMRTRFNQARGRRLGLNVKAMNKNGE